MTRAEAGPLVIKKYGNRRLYDTGRSQYVTLEELAETIRGGADVRVVDAKTGADLTAVTLTQIIVEGRGAASLLPVPLLLQLVRLRDDALAEFFGRWMTLALESYLQTKQGIESVAPYSPFGGFPFGGANPFSRMLGAMPSWPSAPAPQPAPAAEPPSAPPRPRAVERDDVAELRREIDALRKAMKAPPREAAPSRRAPAAPARKR